MDQKAAQKVKKVKPLLWLWRVSKRYQWIVLCLLIVEVALSVLGVSQAWIMRDFIDRAVDGDRNGFFHFGLILVVVVVSQILLRALMRFLSEFSVSTLENCFKRRLFGELMVRDYAEVTAVHSEDWMNRLTSDTVVVADALSYIVPDVVSMAVRLVGALATILVLVDVFSWFIFPAGAALAAFAYLFRRKLKSLHKAIQEASGRVRVFMSERLTNLMIVRTYAQERSVMQGADAAMKEHRAARMRRSNYSNFANIGVGMFVQGAFIVSALYCGYGILLGTISYGTFTAVLSLVGQIQAPFAKLSSYFPMYYAMLASAERLMEAEAFAPDCEEEKKTDAEIRAFYADRFTGIALRDVSFTYRVREENESAMPKSVVLSGLNLSVDKGDAVAITGPSGCGKSTLLKLLMALYPLDAGERVLTETDGAEKLDAKWRGLFAYVPQGNQLMSGTIREVVSLGRTDLSDDAIRGALAIACADEFVGALPTGLDTVLGEKGAGLSEGQMQRLAIARAILSGHPILLLDEATSSLDELTELTLLENLKRLTDRTILFVTHRTRILSICNKEISMQPEGVQTRELYEQNAD